MKLAKYWFVACWMGLVAWSPGVWSPVAWSQNADVPVDPAALERVSYDVKFLASDDLGGRGVGTPGIEQAAQYIESEYKKIGLEPALSGGSYRQPFEVNIGRQLVADSFRLEFKGPQESTVTGELGKTAQPMMVGGSADLSGGLVFVGYGIKSDEHNYNEYANVDVKGKIVVAIRMEPQQTNEKSVFAGTEPSDHARVSNKINAAKEAGAAGMILVNDGVAADSDEKDELLTTDGFGRSGDFPFVQLKRATFNEILKVTPVAKPGGGGFDNLADIEKFIDENLEPVSCALADWNVNYQSKFDTVVAKTDNVIGILRGEGPLAEEYVVIGGHYDHLGMGEVGSRTPQRREIHNGADDNATGTAAVLELARRYVRYDKKPKRTMVFICFSGEERGLLGSAFYVNEEKPVFDLEKTVAMINYDMIGWLRDNKLTIYGTGSGSSFDEIVEKNVEGTGLELNKVASPFAGSDHMPFVQKQVPVMFIHTGLTDVYHTPEDDYAALNMSGAVKVIDYSEKLIWDLTNRDERPVYQDAAGGGRARGAYLGVRFDFADTAAGLAVVSVTADSPGAKAGLQEGDVVVSIDGKKISERSELADLLRAHKEGDKVEVKLNRNGNEMAVQVELGAPQRR